MAQIEMNFEYFIAKRLVRQKDKTYARRVVGIASIAITLSIAVMLISVSVLQGFKDNVKDKIVGFGSHIQVVQYAASGSHSENPFHLDEKNIRSLKAIKNVKDISPIINKSAAIIGKDDFQAVIVKGITPKYDTTFFYSAILQGSMPKMNKVSKQEVLVSKIIADKMNLKIGDKIKVYFYIDDNYRSKKFTISGIYDTGLGDYDERFLIVDAKVLQNIFSLNEDDFSLYEVSLYDFSLLNETADEVYRALPPNKTVMTITEMEPNLFSWLNLLDSNVVMIIMVMILITIVTICSVVLIIIYEKKQFIGVMKSFGTTTRSIIKIFLYRTGYILLRGIVFGNILAIGLEIIQLKTHFFALDAQSYYLDSVPIDISPLAILSVDIGAFVVCIICMIIPASTISRINVVDNLRFS